MAQSKKKSRGTSQRKTSRAQTRTVHKVTKEEMKVKKEVAIIAAFALCVILFLCNFNIIGPVGNALSKVMLGLFGMMAYVFPLALLGLFVYLLREMGNTGSKKVSKTICGILVFLNLSGLFDLVSGIAKTMEDGYDLSTLYLYGVENKKGGGLIAGSLNYLLTHLIASYGAAILEVIVIIICIVLITESSVNDMGRNLAEKVSVRSEASREAREELHEDEEQERLARKQKRDERNQARLEEQALREQKRAEAEKKKSEALEKKTEKKEISENNKILRENKKVSGVTFDTEIQKRSTVSPEDAGNMHEITVNGFDEATVVFSEEELEESAFVPETENSVSNEPVWAGEVTKTPEEAAEPVRKPAGPAMIGETPKTVNTSSSKSSLTMETGEEASTDYKPDYSPKVKIPGKEEPERPTLITPNAPTDGRKYIFPPIDLLTPGKGKTAADTASLNETGNKLIETLKIFGVNARIDSISQGPTVTRYELQPEAGTKVSRIKGLSDDIKLSLATADIRIEAPVPGKSVVGIEVPNKESRGVALRDLISSNEFKTNKSSLTFAVGEDIGGKVVVYDIDQFPHLLIAGATGSGKSVCINTIIMSLIYKSDPDDVKMIMIDPKVVELSVYNPIPHLLIPVVTDAKKAAAALNWAVTEMMDRYKKFAEVNVRDIKGYNAAMENKIREEGPTEFNKKLPRLVIIVDELADLIMVAKNDVEDSICRLAQLARACGIHLIVATQRPSVDVITGLIKANMPSRIAFAVSSGVDSRTILDSVGAEELLGKGDMLFFPKGLKKPVRLQGAFVSDEDVNKVVDFLSQNAPVKDDAKSSIEEQINQTVTTGSGGKSGSGPEQAEFDEYFMDAAKYVIENNKASIGNLQRIFRIGFNRAARIMDKLAECGVVSADEGTKARTVLMTMEEFENYVEENGL